MSFAEGRHRRRHLCANPRTGSGALLSTLLAALPATVLAENATTSMSLDEIAQELNNPATTLRHLKFDMGFWTYQGSLPEADDQKGTGIAFTPTWPIRLDNGKVLTLRSTIPINGDLPNWQPVFFIDYAEFLIRQRPEIDESVGGFEQGHDHLGDISLDVSYGGVNDNGLISTVGLSLVLPTSEDGSASRNQWLLGPEVSLGRIAKWGTYGVRAKHLTDIAGQGAQEVDDYRTNETTLSFFFAYSLGNGWQIESNPTVLYDWEGVSDNQWNVPVGGGISRTFRAGRVPMKFATEIQYFVVSTDRLGPEWLVRFSLTPVFRTPQ